MLARTAGEKKKSERKCFILWSPGASVHADREFKESTKTVNRKMLFVCLLDDKLPDTFGLVKQLQTELITQT